MKLLTLEIIHLEMIQFIINVFKLVFNQQQIRKIAGSSGVLKKLFNVMGRQRIHEFSINASQTRWPSESPDHSPTEHAFHQLKMKLMGELHLPKQTITE